MNVEIRISSQGEDWATIHAVLTRNFAYMDGQIDPPSSLHRWTFERLADEAAAGFVILGEAGERIVSCAFARQVDASLHIGKVAVERAYRGTGLLRRMMSVAAQQARQSGLTALTLQSRIELTANHRAFAALGFAEIARTAHPGYENPTSLTMQRLI